MMIERDSPYIEEITLREIVNNLKKYFKIKRVDIGYRVFFGHQSVGNKSDTYAKYLYNSMNGNRPLLDEEYDNLFALLKEVSGGSEASFINLMKTWFPKLEIYESESDIKTVIVSNLKGTASLDIVFPKSARSDLSSKQFLAPFLQYADKLQGIKMAYQTGWKWLDDPERRNILKQFAEKGVSIQVIANPESVIKEIALTMRDPDLKLDYMGYNETLSKWNLYTNEYDSMDLRISDYPILRKTLIVNFKDGTSQAMLNEYTYGSPSNDSSPRTQISSANPYFSFYQVEFDYLWNHGKTYIEWYAELPQPKETLPPGEYVLVYPVKSIHQNDKIEWTHSILSINFDGVAKLQPDVSIQPDTISKYAPREYSFQGDVVVTPTNIFISLSDTRMRKQMNICFYRIMSDTNRFPGIITDVNTLGQPRSYKCACFDLRSISDVNYETLSKVLHPSKEDEVLLLKTDEISLFDSSSIYKQPTS